MKLNDNSGDLEELAELQSKVNHMRLEEKLGKEGYRYDVQELSEPITKTVNKTVKNYLQKKRQL